MLNSFRARSNCEQEAKFVQDRIVSAEHTIGELCHVFGQYSRKAARLRDKGDELAKIAEEYAGRENINKSLSIALENFADSIAVMSSYGDLRVQNLDSKVIKEFGLYESICKHAKDEVKEIYNAREKEITRKRQLDRIKERNPRNRQQIIQAETELVKASAEFSKTVHNLEEKSMEFEKQKLHDIKSILLDFISIEMGYHARSLECLTRAYKAINSINEEADLEDFEKISKQLGQEFKKNLRISYKESRYDSEKNLFRGSSSLGSLGSLFTTNHRRSPGIPKNFSKSQETLDSMKQPISDTEESSSSDSNTEDVNDTEASTSLQVRKQSK